LKAAGGLQISFTEALVECYGNVRTNIVEPSDESGTTHLQSNGNEKFASSKNGELFVITHQVEQ